MTKGDKCVVGCIRNSSIPRSVRNFFFDVASDVFRRQNSTNIRRVFNATMLDWYCGYANGRQQCILECDDDSFVKTEILKILRPTSYVCNETDFIAYSKCYHQVYEDDKDECESGEKCLPYKMTMINYYYERRSKNISWEEAVQVVLNNLCQYIICGNQCRLNELSTQCGEDSNQVLMEFYRRVVSSLKQIIIEVHHWLTGKALPLLTDSCDQI
uniref:Hexosyltransferase n=2 Tax=Romanomermis culicivorax TaxID=13658 RepID=A0A915JFP8_ROMCU